VSIHIFRESENGLERQTFTFRYEYERLQYFGHFVERRDSKEERWVNDKPRPLTYKAWCKRHEREPLDDDNGQPDPDYVSYLKRRNPILQRTKSGEPKLSGEMGPIEKLPPCPLAVSREALRLFKRTVRVEYRVGGQQRP
jgi:hypothetical protein